MALVVSDRGLAGRLRAAVAEHLRLERGEVSVADVVSGARDDARLGYVVSYLVHGLGVRDVDGATRQLAGLLGDRRLPASVWRDIANAVAANFYRLSEATRAAVADALARAGASDDARLAGPALGALVRLSDDQQVDLRSTLGAGQRTKLAKNFYALFGAEAGGAHPRFARALE